MDSAEFDKFADEYLAVHARNIAITGEQPEFFAEYKVRDVHEILAAEGRPVARILDFGAGIGNSAPRKLNQPVYQAALAPPSGVFASFADQ